MFKGAGSLLLLATRLGDLPPRAAVLLGLATLLLGLLRRPLVDNERHLRRRLGSSLGGGLGRRLGLLLLLLLLLRSRLRGRGLRSRLGLLCLALALLRLSPVDLLLLQQLTELLVLLLLQSGPAVLLLLLVRSLLLRDLLQLLLALLRPLLVIHRLRLRALLQVALQDGAVLLEQRGPRRSLLLLVRPPLASLVLHHLLLVLLRLLTGGLLGLGLLLLLLGLACSLLLLLLLLLRCLELSLSLLLRRLLLGRRGCRLGLVGAVVRGDLLQLLHLLPAVLLGPGLHLRRDRGKVLLRLRPHCVELLDLLAAPEALAEGQLRAATRLATTLLLRLNGLVEEEGEGLHAALHRGVDHGPGLLRKVGDRLIVGPAKQPVQFQTADAAQRRPPSGALHGGDEPPEVLTRLLRGGLEVLRCGLRLLLLPLALLLRLPRFADALLLLTLPGLRLGLPLSQEGPLPRDQPRVVLVRPLGQLRETRLLTLLGLLQELCVLTLHPATLPTVLSLGEVVQVVRNLVREVPPALETVPEVVELLDDIQVGVVVTEGGQVLLLPIVPPAVSREASTEHTVEALGGDLDGGDVVVEGEGGVVGTALVGVEQHLRSKLHLLEHGVVTPRLVGVGLHRLLADDLADVLLRRRHSHPLEEAEVFVVVLLDLSLSQLRRRHLLLPLRLLLLLLLLLGARPPVLVAHALVARHTPELLLCGLVPMAPPVQAGLEGLSAALDNNRERRDRGRTVHDG
eukprot:Hpha_TRINITY_DN15955_c1_g2::TRINITY_DN15955_c1_g2_i1::g.70777::m.70777